MRFSHREIVELQQDMRGWVERKKAAKSGARRMGYAQAARLAVFQFHKNGNPEAAQRHLYQLLDKHKLFNIKHRAKSESTLSGYMDWWGHAGLVMVQDKLRLALGIGRDIVVGGEISRIDLVDKGYRGILLGSAGPNWKATLQMPIVQAAIAERLNRDPGNVLVGVQEWDGSGLNVTQYSSSEIADAIAEFRGLANRGIGLLKKS